MTFNVCQKSRSHEQFLFGDYYIRLDTDNRYIIRKPFGILFEKSHIQETASRKKVPCIPSSHNFSRFKGMRHIKRILVAAWLKC